MSAGPSKTTLVPKPKHSFLKLGHLKLGAAILSKNANAKASAFIALQSNEFTHTVAVAAHASDTHSK